MNKLLEYYQRRILTAQDASQILRTRFVKYTELYIMMMMMIDFILTRLPRQLKVDFYERRV